jgi:uncharacterized BrkB/YihY/UPF0761 family membrane protein
MTTLNEWFKYTMVYGLYSLSMCVIIYLYIIGLNEFVKTLSDITKATPSESLIVWTNFALNLVSTLLILLPIMPSLECVYEKFGGEKM